jgi:hypothetical protein
MARKSTLSPHSAAKTQAARVRTAVFHYLLERHFDGDIEHFSKITGHPIAKAMVWNSGRHVPQSPTLNRIIQKVFTPEFSTIVEFAQLPVGHRKEVQKRLNAILKGYEHSSAIYAFYDTSGTLIYLGKSNGNLLFECKQRLSASYHIRPSKAFKVKKLSRYDVVAYLSAYETRVDSHVDFPRHVESLMLRIHKPPLNEYIGKLTKASPSLPK